MPGIGPSPRMTCERGTVEHPRAELVVTRRTHGHICVRCPDPWLPADTAGTIRRNADVREASRRPEMLRRASQRAVSPARLCAKLSRLASGLLR
jgi:hypothetical protein